MIRQEELTDALLEMIRKSEFGAGDRLPTSRDLVKRFGTSMATISKSMKTLEKMGVIEPRHGSGFFVKPPSPAAPMKRAARSSKLIMAILPPANEMSPSERHFYYNIIEVLQSATNECEERGLILAHHYVEKPEEFPAVLKDFQSRSDILGLCDPCFNFPDLYPLIHTSGIPFIHTGPSVEMFDSVDDSYAWATRKAIEHLLATGRTKILYAGAGKGHPHELEKLKTISETRRRHGLPDGDEWNLLEPDNEQRAGERLLRLREERFKFDAVLCMNDETAMNVLNAFGQDDVAVPGEVAVIGSDDLPGCARSTPPLATIRRGRTEMGRWLIRLLAERRHAPEAPLKTLVVANTFVPRASAG